MMTLPSSDTPLYNHPLPAIEEWLSQMGCEQNTQELHFWTVARPRWQAELVLDVDQLSVRYLNVEGRDIQRSFKYSLSRQDVEDAILAGP
jgi:Protein of unknown function (DUF3143)